MDAEINLVRTTDAVARIESRIAVFVNAVRVRGARRRRIHSRTGTSQAWNDDSAADRGKGRRTHMIAINPDAEIRSGISAQVASAGTIGRSADGQIAKADAESGSEHNADAVDAVEGSRPATP